MSHFDVGRVKQVEGVRRVVRGRLRLVFRPFLVSTLHLGRTERESAGNKVYVAYSKLVSFIQKYGTNVKWTKKYHLFHIIPRRDSDNDASKERDSKVLSTRVAKYL